MIKKDRRIPRTQKCLKNTLLQLMKTKPIQTITIRELCEQADLNRSTFYEYYRDIYELLAVVQNDLFDELNVYVKASQKAAERQDIDTQRNVLTAIIEYMKAHSFLFQTLLHRNEDRTFEKALFQYFTKQFLQEKPN